MSIIAGDYYIDMAKKKMPPVAKKTAKTADAPVKGKKKAPAKGKKLPPWMNPAGAPPMLGM